MGEFFVFDQFIFTFEKKEGEKTLRKILQGAESDPELSVDRLELEAAGYSLVDQQPINKDVRFSAAQILAQTVRDLLDSGF